MILDLKQLLKYWNLINTSLESDGGILVWQRKRGQKIEYLFNSFAALDELEHFTHIELYA